MSRISAERNEAEAQASELLLLGKNVTVKQKAERTKASVRDMYICQTLFLVLSSLVMKR